MTAYSTKGTRVRMSTAAGTPLSVIPTAISSEAPTVVTVADTTGIVSGATVKVGETGFPELDNKMFVVGTVLDATTFELYGSDTSATTGSLAASPDAMTIYNDADFVTICASAFDVADSTTAQIDVSTFCTPGAQLPGATTLGTVSITGYLDKTAAGLLELVKAAEDGAPRLIKIEIPNDQGYLVGEMSFGDISWSIPLEGAYGYSITGTQSYPLTWIHD